MKKLHIANVIRDQKFFDAQIDYHDMTSSMCYHEYFIVTWSKTVEFVYMESIDRIQIVSPDDFIKRLRLDKFDAVFIHNFLYMPLHYMWKIPSEIKVFWFSWGYDIYNTPQSNPYIKISLLHKNSLLVKKNISERKTNIVGLRDFKIHCKKLLRDLLYRKRKDYNNNVEVYKNAVKRVNYYSGVFPEEYDLLRTQPEFQAEKVVYGYTNPKDWEEKVGVNFMKGCNILIGNSADINNNHLDILDYLKDVQIKNKKVIVPLSYGGSQIYTDCVVKAYQKYFGSLCLLITDYLQRDEYFKLLSSVGYAIFCQERQQAVDNIETLMRNGVKIFFSDTSINYKHYKSEGYYVFSIQKELNSESLNTPLSEEQKMHNAKLLHRISTREFRLKCLYDIYDLLNQQKK